MFDIEETPNFVAPQPNPTVLLVLEAIASNSPASNSAGDGSATPLTQGTNSPTAKKTTNSTTKLNSQRGIQHSRTRLLL